MGHEWVRPEGGLTAKWKSVGPPLGITSFAARQQQTLSTLLD
jgi:hypothetical protein